MKNDLWNWFEKHSILGWIVGYGVLFGGLFLFKVIIAPWLRQAFPNFTEENFACCFGILFFAAPVLHITIHSLFANDKYYDNEPY